MSISKYSCSLLFSGINLKPVTPTLSKALIWPISIFDTEFSLNEKLYSPSITGGTSSISLIKIWTSISSTKPNESSTKTVILYSNLVS